jgi:hypothetical protein
MAIFNGGTPAAAAADVQPSGETAPGETQDELFNEEA